MSEGTTETSPTVLSSLGTFHIWMELILAPIFFVLCIVAAVVAWNFRKGWKTVNATVTATPDCRPCQENQCSDFDDYHCIDVPVRFRDSAGTTQSWKVDKEYKDKLVKGDHIQVCYDPSHPQNHAGGACVSNSGRTIAAAVALILAMIIAIFWILNLALRKNRNWQNISGVMEGSSLLGDALMQR